MCRCGLRYRPTHPDTEYRPRVSERLEGIRTSGSILMMSAIRNFLPGNLYATRWLRVGKSLRVVGKWSFDSNTTEFQFHSKPIREPWLENSSPKHPRHTSFVEKPWSHWNRMVGAPSCSSIQRLTKHPELKEFSRPRSSSLRWTMSNIVCRRASLSSPGYFTRVRIYLLTMKSPWRVKALIDSCYATFERGIKVEQMRWWWNHGRIRSSGIPRRVIEVLVGWCNVGWRAWQIREVELLCRARIGFDGRKFSRCERYGVVMINLAYLSARISRWYGWKDEIITRPGPGYQSVTLSSDCRECTYGYRSVGMGPLASSVTPARQAVLLEFGVGQ